MCLQHCFCGLSILFIFDEPVSFPMLHIFSKGHIECVFSVMAPLSKDTSVFFKLSFCLICFHCFRKRWHLFCSYRNVTFVEEYLWLHCILRLPIFDFIEWLIGCNSFLRLFISFLIFLQFLLKMLLASLLCILILNHVLVNARLAKERKNEHFIQFLSICDVS